MLPGSAATLPHLRSRFPHWDANKRVWVKETLTLPQQFVKSAFKHWLTKESRDFFGAHIFRDRFSDVQAVQLFRLDCFLLIVRLSYCTERLSRLYGILTCLG